MSTQTAPPATQPSMWGKSPVDAVTVNVHNNDYCCHTINGVNTYHYQNSNGSIYYMNLDQSQYYYNAGQNYLHYTFPPSSGTADVITWNPNVKTGKICWNLNFFTFS
ncbi:hypothetical protein CPB83DRAFT_840585 [Crepidotus variabilis]|uniref:Uncharacterized protein n=1 Tax=Crepidotus variabilis TaxID=179855 RepID=A0A9P6JIP5_9AGAR|nr:hypothetical protein CPB83DRAFT_840585 [Crepidotus variabilis]